MVESTNAGVGCRCSAADPYPPEGGEGCCTPQVFTSVLLGALACVLMTGGVFLAFHRWDPLWLIVSGIGVVLILIGSVLHCCTSRAHDAGGRRAFSGGKGCCGRPAPDNGHLMVNNGSLTEQLLPLSNARYFPPVVTTYGIEQHSAVVQNINRIIQQQQQSSATSTVAPPASAPAGKSFILLSLAGEPTPANMQNLVATVYQLDDANIASPSGEEDQSVAPSVPATPTIDPMPVTYKSVEVQTCSSWPQNMLNPSSRLNQEASTSTLCMEDETTNTAIAMQQPSSSVPACEIPIPETSINLMDCISDTVPICDTSEEQTIPSALTNTSTNSLLVNEPVPSTSSVILDITVDQVTSSSDLAQQFETTQSPELSDVLIDISNDSPPELMQGETGISNHLLSNSEPECAVVLPIRDNEGISEHSELLPEIESVALAIDDDSTLSVIEDDDDEDSVGRSSPPPSYEDVALDGDSSTNGALNLSYRTGTI